MSLTKAKGNMYSWCSHTHSHLAGPCPHRCRYCYVGAMAKRFPNMAERYGGALRLLEDELQVNYGSGRTIFVDHLNDLWADAVPDEWIDQVLDHCERFPGNCYVFQTKNPKRYRDVFQKSERRARIRYGSILGTTIETNRWMPEIMGKAPAPVRRFESMLVIPKPYKTFVTIEPVLQFDLEELVDWMAELKPDFINIGADSKGHGLPEPSGDQVRALVVALKKVGIEIRKKQNLERLL